MRRCTKIDKYEVWHWLLAIALHLTYISWSWETWLLTIIPGNKINGNTSAPTNPSILTSKFGAGYSKYCVFIFCVEFDWHSLFWCTLRLWDDVFLLGGDQISEVNFYRARITMTEVECFDPLTNEWTLSKALPESRSESGAVVIWKNAKSCQVINM